MGGNFGGTSIVPRGDGRVLYDPYSPCGDSQGHWLAVELGRVNFSDGTSQDGIFWGVSAGEDPTGTWKLYFEADPNRRSTTVCSPSKCPDFPMIGFNTNWIAINTFRFYNLLTQRNAEAQTVSPTPNGTATTFSATLAHLFVQPGSASITEGSITATDDGQGNLTGTGVASGTINYDTGAWTITYQTAPASTATWSATYKTSNLQPEVMVIGRQSAECTSTPGITRFGSDGSFSSVHLACPAETYHSTGNTDPDASILYLIKNRLETQGQVELFEVTGTASAPALDPSTRRIVTGPTAWVQQADPSGQQGTSVTIKVPDDRFSSCVVRNGWLWAAQTVGTGGLNNAPAVQWWQIGIDANAAATPIVSTTPNALVGSVGVNVQNDALFGFSFAKPSSTVGGFTILGTYLQSGYIFQSHLDNTRQPAYFYQGGLGPYEWIDQTSLKTGDFYHTTVDPLDDLTLWTTEAFAGTAVGSINCSLKCQTVYGWASSFATLKPPGVLYEGGGPATESEPPTSETCGGGIYTSQTTVNPPSGAKDGDILIANIVAGVPFVGPTFPPGWTLLTMSNLTPPQSTLVTQNACNFSEFSKIGVHVFSSTDTVPYVFSSSFIPVATTSPCSPGCWLGEIGGYIHLYRFAGTDFTKYGTLGYANGNATASSTVTFNAPASRQLLNVFSGSGGDPDEGLGCASFSTPTGSPPLSLEGPPLQCTQPGFLPADIWTGSGGSFGDYLVTDSATSGASPLPAWQVLIPPQ